MPEITDGRASAGPIDLAVYLAQPDVQQKVRQINPTVRSHRLGPHTWGIRKLLHAVTRLTGEYLACNGLRTCERRMCELAAGSLDVGVQVDEAVQRVGARLRAAGQTVPRAKALVPHVVHVSPDQRKV